MAVPKYYEMNIPFLICLQDGLPHTKVEIRSYVREYFHLTDNDIAEVLPSGRQTVFSNRVAWASTYLKKAGLIASPARATFVITNTGKQVLADMPSVIDVKYLSQFDSFNAFKNINIDNNQASQSSEEDENTPDDTFETAFAQINDNLADDLLAEVMKLSPVAFEHMVLDLMGKMGYGTFANAAKSTAISGDEGIDGIIMEDKLGFDLIYIQAKHWSDDHTVGRPEVQAFVGAISGKGGKGLFVTTSKFSKQAIEYAQVQHVILIDGAKLSRLMIEHNFGVSVQKTFEIKSIDNDVFYDYQDI